jgi:phage-related baseplate assembly protein
MSGGFTAIDLSQIEAPSVVERLSFEEILAELARDLIARDPEYGALLESDPAVKILEVAAARELLLRQRVNDAARDVMLAYASGSDLDNLAALLGVKRLVVGTDASGVPILEDDTRFLRRVQTAPEAYSSAGPAGAYVFWALTLAPSIVDASVVQASPGSLIVTLLGAAADGMPSEEELDAVRDGLSAEDLRPLTDAVAVSPPVVRPYSIDADLWLLPGPDGEVVRSRAEAHVRALVAESRKLGRDVPRSAIIAALHRPGVSRVDLKAPAADVVVTPRELAANAGVVVRVAGRET